MRASTTSIFPLDDDHKRKDERRAGTGRWDGYIERRKRMKGARGETRLG
jgi:hypothetical protein